MVNMPFLLEFAEWLATIGAFVLEEFPYPFLVFLDGARINNFSKRTANYIFYIPWSWRRHINSSLSTYSASRQIIEHDDPPHNLAVVQQVLSIADCMLILHGNAATMAWR